MTDHTALGPGREFDFVRALLARWGHVAAGVGDDAALIDVPADHRLTASMDSAVEGVHFRRDWLSPREIGWRTAAAALSDLAAMAADPIAMLVSMSVPTAWMNDVLDVSEFAQRFDIPLTEIGRVEAGDPAVIATLRGARVAPGGGFDHFS